MDAVLSSIRLVRDDATPTTTDLQSLLHRLIGLAEEGEALRIAIDYKGQRVELIAGKAPTEPTLPTPPAMRKRPAPHPQRFSEMEDCIVEALGDKTMKGQEIADASGYPFDSPLRACLAALRRRGILTGSVGQPGYSAAVKPAVHAAAVERPAQERSLTFIPTGFQKGILAALEGKAMRTDALGAAVGDRSRLFKPGGLKELRERGLVDHHKRAGFYRPDAPPPALGARLAD